MPKPYLRCCRRYFTSHLVFDPALKSRQRRRALISECGQQFDYLRQECAYRLVDRLDDISRSFPRALEIGSYRGHVFDTISSRNSVSKDHQVGGIVDFVQSDVMPIENVSFKALGTPATSYTKTDERLEEFPPQSFDLVMSSLSMHWVNDLPLHLVKIREILRPDGAFLGCMLGGNTLNELRHCFYLAEQERKGGFSPHCSPLTRPSDVSSLMQRAGFTLPTVDIDTLTVSYPDAFSLMEHLDGMGERTAALSRQYNVGRETLLAMSSIYQALYGDGDGGILATFQVIYVIGWAPHASQPKSKQRGSAQISLKEVL